MIALSSCAEVMFMLCLPFIAVKVALPFHALSQVSIQHKMHECPTSAHKTQVRQLLVMQEHVCSERDAV